MHEGKRVCLDCQKFINWIPKKEGNYAQMIQGLFDKLKITNNFTESLKRQFKKQKFLSDKQYSALEKIVNSEDLAHLKGDKTQ